MAKFKQKNKVNTRNETRRNSGATEQNVFCFYGLARRTTAKGEKLKKNQKVAKRIERRRTKKKKIKD